MNKENYLRLLMIMLLSLPMMVACSSDDKDEPQDETSTASIEYLCSTLMWVYAPDSGIKSGEEYESFFFGKIGNDLICTITKSVGGSKETSLKRYNFTYTPPTISLKERQDITGIDVPGGETRTLTVYKLTRPKYANLTQDWLLINGKQYASSIGGGININ